jgi:hypothetical protein
MRWIEKHWTGLFVLTVTLTLAVLILRFTMPHG